MVLLPFNTKNNNIVKYQFQGDYIDSYNLKFVIQKPVTLGSGARAILFFHREIGFCLGKKGSFDVTTGTEAEQSRTLST